jgi:type II secretory pathway pseudopilin PulG
MFTQFRLIAAGIAVISLLAAAGGLYLKGRSDGRALEHAEQQARDLAALDAAEKARRDRTLRDLTDPNGMRDRDPFRRD